MLGAFLRAVIDAVNAVQPRVWQVLQFLALLALVVFGGHLLVRGQKDAGLSLITGAFALLKYEVSGNANTQQ